MIHCGHGDDGRVVRARKRLEGRPRRAHLDRGNESGQISRTPCRRKRGMAVSVTADVESGVLGRRAGRGAESTQASGRRVGVSTETRGVWAGRPVEEDSEGVVGADATQQVAGQWRPLDGLQQEPCSWDGVETLAPRAPSMWMLQSTRLRQRAIHVFMGNGDRGLSGDRLLLGVRPRRELLQVLVGVLGEVLVAGLAAHLDLLAFVGRHERLAHLA